MTIINQIQKIRSQFRSDLENLSSEHRAINQVRIKYLGRKGLIASLFVQMGQVDSDERPKMGMVLNKLKSEITLEIDGLSAVGSIGTDTATSAVDLTLPGDPIPVGSIHPLTQVMEEIKSIFLKLGFSLAYGPEIDTEFYNFEALNMPKHHPARDMQDTFYITDNYVLRTHTSNTQIHVMENQEPPVRVICPGRVYRNETISIRSYCLFHQLEGLYVAENVSLAEMKGTLEYFCRHFFGEEVKARFRPSFFPFTEPSAEVDITCLMCDGYGCSMCKNSGWLEILGCGMVDPAVLEMVGYDSLKWSGYAWGMGIERLAILKHGIDDIRLYFNGDVRFLRQFS